MSGIRCPMCDYDLDDCNCDDRYGDGGRPSQPTDEEPVAGLFEQMGIDGEPVLPMVRKTPNDQLHRTGASAPGPSGSDC